MYRTLIFNDPYSGASMNARDTLLFCAYNNFTIPHDIVGAILFGDALAGQVEEIITLSDINMFIPSLHTFIADADWYLAAIKSMGYHDIVEEFERINREYHEYARNYHLGNQDYLEPLIQELESLIPSRYMDIIKNVRNNFHIVKHFGAITTYFCSHKPLKKCVYGSNYFTCPMSGRVRLYVWRQF